MVAAKYAGVLPTSIWHSQMTSLMYTCTYTWVSVAAACLGIVQQVIWALANLSACVKCCCLWFTTRAAASGGASCHPIGHSTNSLERNRLSYAVGLPARGPSEILSRYNRLSTRTYQPEDPSLTGLPVPVPGPMRGMRFTGRQSRAHASK